MIWFKQISANSYGASTILNLRFCNMHVGWSKLLLQEWELYSCKEFKQKNGVIDQCIYRNILYANLLSYSWGFCFQSVEVLC